MVDRAGLTSHAGARDAASPESGIARTAIVERRVPAISAIDAGEGSNLDVLTDLFADERSHGLLFVLAKKLAGFSVDEVHPAAGKTIDPYVIVSWHILVIVQPLLNPL